MSKQEIITKLSTKYNLPQEELNTVWTEAETMAKAVGFTSEQDIESYCQRRLISYYAKLEKKIKQDEMRSIECKVNLVSVKTSDYGLKKRVAECEEQWNKNPQEAIDKGFCDGNGNLLRKKDKNGNQRVIDLEKDIVKLCWGVVTEKISGNTSKQRIVFTAKDWKHLPAFTRFECKLGKKQDASYYANSLTQITNFEPIPETEILALVDKYFNKEAISLKDLDAYAAREGKSFDEIVIVRADLGDIAPTPKGGRQLTINNMDADNSIAITANVTVDQMGDVFTEIQEGAVSLILSGSIMVSQTGEKSMIVSGIYCPEMFKKKIQPETINPTGHPEGFKNW